MKTHEKQFLFACRHDGCNQVYEYQRNLDSHIRIHHMDIRFSCEFCSRKLSTKQKLDEHIIKIHENPKKRKSPITLKENRKQRRDIGLKKRSEVTKLCGIKLSSNLEKIIINRHDEENEL